MLGCEYVELDSAGASSGGGDSVSDSIAMLFSDIIVNQKITVMKNV